MAAVLMTAISIAGLATGPAAPVAATDGVVDLGVRWNGDKPSRVIVGTHYGASVLVTNHGSATADAATVTFDLPAGAELVASSYDRDLPGAEPCEVAGPTVTCTVGDLPADGDHDAVFLTLRETIPAPAVTTTATATSATAEVTPDPHPNTDSATYEIADHETDLRLLQWMDEPSPRSIVGNIETVAAWVGNYGPSPSDDLTATFTLPDGAQATGAGVTFGLYPGADGCVIDGETVTCKVGDAPVYGADFVWVQFVPTRVATGEVVTLTLSSSTPEATPDRFANTSSTAPFDVVEREVDLTVGWTTQPSARSVVGNQERPVLRVSNNGPSTADATTVTFDLPAEVAIDEVHPSWTYDGAEDCEIDGRTVTCIVGAMPAHTWIDMTVKVTPTTPATGLTATASVTSAIAEVAGDPSINTATTAPFGIVDRQVDLGLEWVYEPTPRAVVGNRAFAAVRVTNDGPSIATATTVTFDLPVGADVDEAFSNATWAGAEDCEIVDHTVSCNIGDVPVGGTADVYAMFTPRVAAAGVPVTASVTSSVAEVVPDPTANTVTSTFDVVAEQADLAVSWEGGFPAPLVVGEQRYAFVRIVNRGPSIAVDTTVTIELPADATHVSMLVGSPGAEGCTRDGGTVTCHLGDVPVNTANSVFVMFTPRVPGTGVRATATVASGVAEATPNTYPNVAATAPFDVLPVTPTIAGSVADTAGNGLVGVEVRAYNSAGVTVRTTTTGVAGQFALRDLPTGVYTLRYAKTGFVTEYYDDAATAVTATPIELSHPGTVQASVQLEATAGMAGTVTDEGGAPLVGVEVRAYNTSGATAKATTTSVGGGYVLDGLAPGTYRLRFARAGVVTEFFSDAVSLATATPITLTPGVTVTADATVSATATVTGAVTEDSGAPLVGVEVRAYDASGTTAKATTTSAGGGYVLDGLAPGTYRLRFARAGVVTEFFSDAVSLATATPIVLTAGGTFVADATVSATASVAGVVTDDSGAPLAGVEVRAYGASGATAKATTTNAAGAYVLDGLAAGTYTLRFARAGVVTEYHSNASAASSATPITLSPGSELVADATVSLTATVTGAVIDGGGTPLAGVEVRAYSASGVTAKATTTSVGGGYVLDGLAPGTYRLRFARAGVVTQFFSDAVSLATATAITLTPGVTVTADATVSLTATVTGAVIDGGGTPLAGVEVRAYTASGTTAKATTTTAAGVFVLDGLAPGTYRLRFARAGVVTEFFSDAVSLATATPITLTPGSTTTADATLIATGSS
ncbi:MAG TPA: carboxypeptidase regulatory-like domain-containing protein [Iamia sp.]|nr:carboxypeptidase regulatory-like domain-containing protein [Iamia sp.]